MIFIYYWYEFPPVFFCINSHVGILIRLFIGFFHMYNTMLYIDDMKILGAHFNFKIKV